VKAKVYLPTPLSVRLLTLPSSVIDTVPTPTKVAQALAEKPESIPVKDEPSIAGKAPVSLPDASELASLSNSPVVSGSVSVRLVLELGEARVNVPVPDALGVNAILLII
tara:strand:- start:1620 stop:1946 length:327 start_codon:yes stop_codon:yes gene_type:complete